MTRPKGAAERVGDCSETAELENQLKPHNLDPQ